MHHLKITTSLALIAAVLALFAGSLAFATEPVTGSPTTNTSSQVVSTAVAGSVESVSHGNSSKCCTSPKVCKCRERDDEIWMINTRCSPCCIDDAEAADPTMEFSRRDRTAHRWVQATREEFFSGSDSQLPTTVWVHGARTTSKEAVEVGMQMYRELLRCFDGPKTRFVIWSWNAHTTRRPKRDLIEQGAIAISDGYRLGWVLSRIDDASEVNLVGFSFGPRIIGSALNGLAGRKIDGHAIQVGSRTRAGYNVASYATAIHDYWFEPGEQMDGTLSQVDQWLFFNNGCDRALKHYHRVSCGACAIGYSGIRSVTALGDLADRVSQFESSGYIGKSHSSYSYMYTGDIISATREVVLPAVAEVKAAK